MTAQLRPLLPSCAAWCRSSRGRPSADGSSATAARSCSRADEQRIPVLDARRGRLRPGPCGSTRSVLFAQWIASTISAYHRHDGRTYSVRLWPRRRVRPRPLRRASTAPAQARPLADPVSLGVHESQSRIGRTSSGAAPDLGLMPRPPSPLAASQVGRPGSVPARSTGSSLALIRTESDETTANPIILPLARGAYEGTLQGRRPPPCGTTGCTGCLQSRSPGSSPL